MIVGVNRVSLLMSATLVYDTPLREVGSTVCFHVHLDSVSLSQSWGFSLCTFLERKRQPRWNEFLKAHFSEMAATDFFTVEVHTAFSITRYYVMFVIELGSRREHVTGITHPPYAGWTEQIARNLTEPVSGFLWGIRYLNDDRVRCLRRGLPRFCNRLASNQASCA